MNLMKLLKNTEYKGEYIDLDISSISHDSRKINKDGLFVSLKGKKDDGGNYIDQAISNGAIAVLANNRNIKIKNNIPIINVNQRFEKENPDFIKKFSYFVGSIHLTPEGNTLIAETMVAPIKNILKIRNQQNSFAK